MQMFLQNLSEFDSLDFINAGQKMFEANQVRYFVKFVFLEVLNQIDILDDSIKNFIINNCENKTYESHIINNVIFSRPKYIRLLRQYGILDNWFYNPQKKDIVLNLLISCVFRRHPDTDFGNIRTAYRNDPDSVSETSGHLAWLTN